MSGMEPIQKQTTNHFTTHNSSTASRYHDEDENDFLKHDKTENIEI